ncbi:MAG: hypothetical protein Q3M30_16275 [Candidatus Electrothrix sp. Rat3]|nr:hypothetical protein [Candidatus Electrothrix rattekaaiensis]
MTQILFWNLMNFSIKRIQGTTKANAPLAAQSLQNILSAVQGNAPADIFALIELPPGPGGVKAQGNLIKKGSSSQGVITLMSDLNKAAGGKTNPWKIVPPVVTGTGGKAEGLAVFYRSDKLKFVGPWKHTGILGGATQFPGVNPSTPYPKPWDNCLPAGTTQGGQWEYKDSIGKIIEYPQAGERRPWRVQFQDNNKNEFDIFAFHAPFGKTVTIRRTAALSLSKTPDIIGPMTGLSYPAKLNYARILGGDFNLDANAPQDLNALNYLTLPPNGPFTGEFLTFIKGAGYYKTSIRANKYALITKGNYPFYEYAASAYDQIFTMRQNNILPILTVSGQMVVNQVIGADALHAGPLPPKGGAYGLQTTLPGAGTAANVSYPCRMANDIASIYSNWPGKKDACFRNINNYGHIRRTSDHMGVVIDVS